MSIKSLKKSIKRLKKSIKRSKMLIYIMKSLFILTFLKFFDQIWYSFDLFWSNSKIVYAFMSRWDRFCRGDLDSKINWLKDDSNPKLALGQFNGQSLDKSAEANLLQSLKCCMPSFSKIPYDMIDHLRRTFFCWIQSFLDWCCK